MGEAARFLAGDERADHIDLNFGCPVAKVTRKGGGSALPVHRALFRDIVRAAVRGAGDVPVTVKLRIGIDDGVQTYLDAGRIAQDEGAAAVALHARTAAQHYSGRADWPAIAALREVVTAVPVLGNGDIWQASDALAMVDETGCDGVVVGRGCLGRPWLFGDLARAFAGLPVPAAPPLAEVVAVLRRHAHLLAEWLTEPVAVRDVRKHVGWYLQGYPVGGEVRRRLTATGSIAELDAELDRLAADHPEVTILPAPGQDLRTDHGDAACRLARLGRRPLPRRRRRPPGDQRRLTTGGRASTSPPSVRATGDRETDGRRTSPVDRCPASSGRRPGPDDRSPGRRAPTPARPPSPRRPARGRS
jgi:nifR3 family TIM-barrel protein